MRGIGINPVDQPHYTDHLATVCYIMKVPLLFVDFNDAALAEKYYPNVEIQSISFNEINPDFIIENFDVIISSELWKKSNFYKTFRDVAAKKNKKQRYIYCPHGFSDKGFYLKQCVDEDIVFIYGQNMLDLLASHGVLDKLNNFVISGNYRYTYYKENKKFMDEITYKEILHSLDPSNKTILYAPTWHDCEGGTSFFEATSFLLEELPDGYNILVKPHPRLEDDIAYFYKIQGLCEKKKNVVFIKDFPLIYPLSSYSDIYLGDLSSVGYDFLTFNKPMFFLNMWQKDKESDRSAFLYKCGVDIIPDNFNKIYEIIDSNLPDDEKNFSEIRKNIYDYTFGSEKSFDDIRSDILKAVSTS